MDFMPNIPVNFHKPICLSFNQSLGAFNAFSWSHIIPTITQRFQSSSNRCRVNEPSPGAPVAHWRCSLRGPNTWEIHLRVTYSNRKSLLVARPQFIGGQNNWEKSTPNLSGVRLRSNTVNTQGRVGPLWAGHGGRLYARASHLPS